MSPKPKRKWCLSLKAPKQGELPLTDGRISVFVLLRPSTDWKRPTHIRVGNYFTHSTDLNVNLLRNIPTDTPTVILTKCLGTLSLSQVDTKLIITSSPLVNLVPIRISINHTSFLNKDNNKVIISLNMIQLSCIQLKAHPLFS